MYIWVLYDHICVGCMQKVSGLTFTVDSADLFNVEARRELQNRVYFRSCETEAFI